VATTVLIVDDHDALASRAAEYRLLAVGKHVGMTADVPGTSGDARRPHSLLVGNYSVRHRDSGLTD